MGCGGREAAVSFCADFSLAWAALRGCHWPSAFRGGPNASVDRNDPATALRPCVVEVHGRCRGQHSHGACQPEKALRKASGASAAAGTLEKVSREASSRQASASTEHGRATHLG